jgi:hypothetical protein
MNPKLFGAIVVAGVASTGVSACRTGILASPDLTAVADHAVAHDMALPSFDLAQPVVDFAASDLQQCCTFGPGDPADLSGCIPIVCVLIL